MKTIIISELNGSPKKLSWVDECDGGIYFGFYGKAKEMHFSYHKDGKVHLKLGSKYLPLYEIPAIRDIKNFIKVAGSSFTLEEGYEFAMGDYKKIKDVDTVVYLNPSIIRRDRTLCIDAYLIRLGAEIDCIRHIENSYQTNDEQGFELLSVHFIKLNKIRGFRISIVLIGANLNSGRVTRRDLSRTSEAPSGHGSPAKWCSARARG